MATRLAPSAETISFEEFLEAYDGVHAEWVAGEAFVISPVLDRNQDIADWLTALFRVFVEEERIGVVRSAPEAMRIGGSAREPDLMFIAAEHFDRIKPTHIEGAPDLAVEFISPDSRRRDRADKFYEYEQAGVREYWLIEPGREQAEIYRLNERGVYEPAPVGDPPRLRSEVIPGLWIDPAWMWAEPLPAVKVVLKEWGLI
ncbi:MAG TPA: Uma2 family endonuclease [Longimicrobium sp.]